MTDYAKLAEMIASSKQNLKNSLAGKVSTSEMLQQNILQQQLAKETAKKDLEERRKLKEEERKALEEIKEEEPVAVAQPAAVDADGKPKRGRGRPKGSRNKALTKLTDTELINEFERLSREEEEEDEDEVVPEEGKSNATEYEDNVKYTHKNIKDYKNIPTGTIYVYKPKKADFLLIKQKTRTSKKRDDIILLKIPYSEKNIELSKKVPAKDIQEFLRAIRPQLEESKFDKLKSDIEFSRWANDNKFKYVGEGFKKIKNKKIPPGSKRLKIDKKRQNLIVELNLLMGSIRSGSSNKKMNERAKSILKELNK